MTGDLCRIRQGMTSQQIDSQRRNKGICSAGGVHRCDGGSVVPDSFFGASKVAAPMPQCDDDVFDTLRKEKFRLLLRRSAGAVVLCREVVRHEDVSQAIKLRGNLGMKRRLEYDFGAMLVGGPLLSRQYPAFWNKYSIDSTYSAVMA